MTDFTFWKAYVGLLTLPISVELDGVGGWKGKYAKDVSDLLMSSFSLSGITHDPRNEVSCSSIYILVPAITHILKKNPLHTKRTRNAPWCHIDFNTILKFY